MSGLLIVGSHRQVRYRRPLNKQQGLVLLLLYWYRFCTSKQLAFFLGKDNHKSIQNKLQILEAQGLITKRYDNSYKRAGRSAEYHITPHGARELRKLRPNLVCDRADKSVYRNKTVSEEFVSRCLAITGAAEQLERVYGKGSGLVLAPRCSMLLYDFFPSWNPDLFFHAAESEGAPLQYCFLDIWDGTKPFFVSVRKASNYVRFLDDGYWPEGTPTPLLLSVCKDGAMQRKLMRCLRHVLDEAWEEGVVFATTTLDKFYAQSKPSDAIWSKVPRRRYKGLKSLLELQEEGSKGH